MEVYTTYSQYIDTLSSLIADYAYINKPNLDQNKYYDYLRNTLSFRFPQTYEEVANLNAVTQKCANYRNEFLTYMLENEYGKQKSIEFLIDTIKTIEDKIINTTFDSTMTNDENVDLLKYYSILRYSLVYWYEVDSHIRTDYLNAEYEDYGWNGTGMDMPCKTKAQYDADWSKTHPFDGHGYEAAAYSKTMMAAKSVANAIGDAFIKVGKWLKNLI